MNLIACQISVTADYTKTFSSGAVMGTLYTVLKLIGFESEDDWFDYRLENDPRFLRRIEAARASLRAGKGVKPEEIQ